MSGREEPTPLPKERPLGSLGYKVWTGLWLLGPNRNLLQDLGGSQPQAPKAPRDHWGHCPEEMIRGVLTTPTPDARDPSKAPDHPGLDSGVNAMRGASGRLGVLLPFCHPSLHPACHGLAASPAARSWRPEAGPPPLSWREGHREPLRGAHTAVVAPHTGCPTCLPSASQHCSPSNGRGHVKRVCLVSLEHHWLDL